MRRDIALACVLITALGGAAAGQSTSARQTWTPPRTPDGQPDLQGTWTSLVIDPPDGRVPLRPEAEAARDYNQAHERDSYEFMSVWDRCITRSVPGGMFPAGYNNAYQIVQTPGYVVIHYEMIHDARIIPIDNRPHVPDRVRSWNGDPRGRWDGNTHRDPTYRIYEYACHEGNRAVENVLRDARALEKRQE